MLETLILYGSAARDDLKSHSDVDLFGIGAQHDYSMTVKKRVNLALYSMHDSLQMAKSGELFMLHIIKEGKVLYDSKSNFQKLKISFEYKSQYDKEIKFATELGWALVYHGKYSDNSIILNKRIAWCVRTILIALSAEQRDPKFSARELSKFSGTSNVEELIELKNKNVIKKSNERKFSDFLLAFGSTHPEWMEKSDLSTILTHFMEDKNVVGVQTMKRLSSGSGDFGY